MAKSRKMTVFRCLSEILKNQWKIRFPGAKGLRSPEKEGPQKELFLVIRRVIFSFFLGSALDSSIWLPRPGQARPGEALPPKGMFLVIRMVIFSIFWAQPWIWLPRPGGEALPPKGLSLVIRMIIFYFFCSQSWISPRFG